MNQLFLQHPEWSTLKKILMFHGATAEQLNEYEASGNPVVFETNVARPLQRLLLTLLPKQSGSCDPSPSNIRPLLPWGEVGTWTGGKNLFDITQYSYKYDSMTIDGATSSIIDSSVYADNSSRIKFSQVFGVGTYTMKGNISGEGCKGLRLLCSSQITGSVWNNSYSAYWKNFGSGNEITFTLGEPSTIGLVLITGVATEPSTISNLQLEVGSQSSSFTPYTPITPHPVNLQGITPPVYGCELDLTTGEVWGTYRRQVFDGDEALNEYGSYTGGIRLNSGLLDDAVQGDRNAIANEAVLELNVPSTINRFGFRISGGSGKLAIFVPDSMFDGEATAAKFKTWLNDNNLEICYTLATPVFLATLTPQQISAIVGVNTVWSDADGIELTYLKKG